MTTVFVTGINGYIAQHIAKQLLAKNYSVVGTVRSSEKAKALHDLFGNKNLTIEIVEVIEKEGAFDEVLKKHPEVTVFLHTASPVTFASVDHEKETLLPAIEGTKNVLKAVKKYGPQVANVVITSSGAAIKGLGTLDGTHTLTEDDWTSMTYEQALESATSAYFGAKTFAEKAAWDFAKNEKVNFSLNVVSPSYTFGPQAFDESAKGTLNFSAEMVNKLLHSKPDGELPDYKGVFMDVRDVAKAHIVAFESPKAKGERMYLVTEKFTTQLVLDSIRKQFPDIAKKIAVGKPGSGAEVAKTFYNVDNTKTRKILGFDFISLDQSVHDTVVQILKNEN